MKTRRECAYIAYRNLKAAYIEQQQALGAHPLTLAVRVKEWRPAAGQMRRAATEEIRRQRLLGTVHLAGPECRDDRRKRRGKRARDFVQSFEPVVTGRRAQRRFEIRELRRARKASAYSRKGVR